MSSGARLAVLISGRGSNLQSIIDAISAGRLDATIRIVLSNRREAAGLQRARDAGIEAVFLDPRQFADRDAYDAAVADVLRHHSVDLVCLAGFMRLVGRPLLDAFPERVLNIHPSLLPAFPGLDAQRQAIAHGVRVSGATVHLVTGELDGGPIVVQAAVPVLDDDTAETLSARILVEEHRIYPHAISIVLSKAWHLDGRRFVNDRRAVPSADAPAMRAAIHAAVPFPPAWPFKALVVGDEAEHGAAALRIAFAQATVTARTVKLDALDWWDAMFGADLVVVDRGLERVNDAKKQYLYKAAVDRMSAGGALIVAGALESQQLLHHLIWLKHAGFSVAECFWRVGGDAVFGGVKLAPVAA